MPGIGETLREERLSRGLTHEYVSQIIKIRPEFLDALEEENLSALPGNFYAKNFLRRYADFLDLDSSSLVQRFILLENGGTDAPPQLIVQPVNRAPVALRHWRPNFGIAAAFAVLAVVGLALAYRAFLAPPPRTSNTSASTVPTPSSIAVAVQPSPTPQPVVPAPTAQPARVVPTARRATQAPTTAIVARAPTAAPEPTNTATAHARRQTAVPDPVVRATATSKPTNTPTPQPTNPPTPR
nr:helix-turn-helix domain-containing protein [Chloroflexota bacterium]